MKFYVDGCSFTKGHGLGLEQNDPLLWVNQLILSQFPNAEITNLAESGSSNADIFKRTAGALLKESYDFVLVGWTDISRFTYTFGLELYRTTVNLNNPLDININSGITISKKKLQKIGDNLKKYRSDHYDLLDLVIYTNILTKLSKNKICFVNGLSYIEKDYFVKKKITLPSHLSKFEQDILTVDTRDDDEIFKLYNKIHLDYEKFGGIQEENWLNLYDSLRSMQVDYVSVDDQHPGYKSQDKFVKQLLPKFIKKFNKKN